MSIFLQIYPLKYSPKIDPYPQGLVRLLSYFPHVFKSPTSLPPTHLHDHRIPLPPYANPINARPYHYPYYQKTEIERMVREMLDSGLICPSCSPFSSPILLVKKADGERRFCVDYRALNAITIKEKYPFLVIEELLDELHEAKFFSKLNLRSEYHQIRVRTEDIPKMHFKLMKDTMSLSLCHSDLLTLRPHSRA